MVIALTSPALRAVSENGGLLRGLLDIADGDHTILTGAPERGEVDAERARQAAAQQAAPQILLSSLWRAALGLQSAGRA